MANRTASLIAKLVDEVSGPARNMAGSLKSTTAALDALKSKAGKIDAFRQVSRSLDDASQKFRLAQQNVRQIKAEMEAGGDGAKKLGGALRAAERQAEAAGSAFKAQGAKVREMRAALEQAGVPLNRLAAYERDLAAQTNRATAAMRRQQVAAKALNGGGGTSRRLDVLSRSGNGARTPVGGGIGANAATSAGAGLLARYGPSAAMSGVIGAGVGATMATQSSLSLEKAMYRVKKATDTSGDAADVYKKKILDLSRSTGMAKEELAETLASAGFAGRPKEELLAFTEYSAKATKAWDTSAETTGQALAELGNIYQANQTRIEEIGDAINSVADNSASKETDLLDFLRRTGSTGAILGIGAEKMLAFGASMKEVGVQSEVAATGMNALLGKIATAPDDEDWGKQLKSLGLDAKKFGKAVKADAVGAIVQLLTKINKIEDGSTKLQKLEEIFGKEYADDIAKMAGNLAGVNKQLEFVAKKSNYLGSVSKGFELIKDEDFNRLDRAKRSIDVLAQRLGEPLKIGAGGISEKIIEFVDRLEKGDTVLQRIIDKMKGASGSGDKKEPTSDDPLGRLSTSLLGTIDPKFGKSAAEQEMMEAFEDRARQAEKAKDTLSRPAEIEARIRKQQGLVDEAKGATGMRRSILMDQAKGAEVQIAKLRADLVEANDAIASLKVQQSRDRGAFGLDGPTGKNGDVGPGLGAFGFDVNDPTRLPSRRVPLPPARPPELGGAAPKVDASQIEGVGQKIDEVKTKAEGLGGLNITVPITSPGAGTVIQQLQQIITLAGQASAAANNVGGGARTGKVSSALSGSFTDQGM